MKSREFSERWIIATVSVLMVLALGLLARNLLLNGDRALQLGEVALEQSMDSQRLQLKLQMKSCSQNLIQQAEYITLDDSASGPELINRWLPLLRSRFAIMAVSITDEQGGEQKLERADSSWKFTSTDRSSAPAETFVQEWPIRSSLIPPPVPEPPSADPREATWYSQALENRQDEPVWSESRTKTGKNLFQASQLVRSRSSGTSFHVVHFEIDASALMEGLPPWSPELSNIVLSSNGDPYSPLDTSPSGLAWHTMLRNWQQDHPTTVLHESIGGQEWLGRILPMELNGATLYTGALIRESSVAQWTSQGRLAMWTVLVLLVLLATLLITVFTQTRGTERKLRKHERRSNLQARHLAKALVEREVLDREVHHRVKNNLQVVSSLLNLQAQRVPGEEARSEFMRGKRRIDSMALVHHKLYKQNDLSAVDLAVFLDDLAKAVSAMFEPESRTVSHSVDTNGICCDADTSIQLGMIACELLANCHQHAFPYATGGHIHLAVRKAENGIFSLTVKDNGKGFDATIVDPSHLGLDVVEALADQLDGSVHTEIDGGTAVTVTFKPIHPSGS